MSAEKTKEPNVRKDEDGDGMPDAWNQRMPALSFIAAMLALIPTLFAIRTSITELKHSGPSRTAAFLLNIGVIVLTTIAILCSAYGERAKTAKLAFAARRIAVIETVIAVLLIIIMFFKTG